MIGWIPGHGHDVLGRLASAQVHSGGEPPRRPTTRRRSGWASPSSPTTASRRARRPPTRTATRINASAFNVARSYINVTGNISHIVAFRDHAGHRARNGRRQLAQRQPGVPHQVRLRAVQPRRLDDARILRRLRHPADAVARLRRGHLPLSLPGHDVRRARGLFRVRRRRRVVSLPAPVELTATCTSASTTARTTTGPRPTTRRRSWSAARCGRSRRADAGAARHPRDGVLRRRPLRQGRPAQALHRRR